MLPGVSDDKRVIQYKPITLDRKCKALKQVKTCIMNS